MSRHYKLSRPQIRLSPSRAKLPAMPLIVILIILLILFGGGGYYMGPGIGYYGGGGISLVLALIIIYLLFGRGRERLSNRSPADDHLWHRKSSQDASASDWVE